MGRVLTQVELDHSLAHTTTAGDPLARSNYCSEVRESHETLRAQRDEARRMYCTSRSRACPRVICVEQWPDAADELFPRKVK